MGCSGHENIQIQITVKKKYVIFLIGKPDCGIEIIKKMINENFYYMSFHIRDCFEENGNLKGNMNPEKLAKAIFLGIYALEVDRWLLTDFPINKKFFDIWEREIRGKINMASIYFEINKEEKKKRIIKENKETEGVKKSKKIEKETESILSVFEKRKGLIRIDGMKTEEEIYDIIFKELKEREFVSPGGHNIIFLIGGPGSGKRIQGERIYHNFDYASLSVVDFLINYFIKEKVNGYEEIEKIMKEGNLISEQQYISIIKEMIIRIPKRKAALYLEVSTEEMKKRELERKEKRFIDTKNCIDKRIDIFETKTKQVLSIFERREMLIRIDGMKTVDEIEKEIIKKFKDKNIK